MQDPEDISGTTTKLQYKVSRFQAGRNLLSELENKTIARSKPEVTIFNQSQLVKKARIISSNLCGIRRKLRHVHLPRSNVAKVHNSKCMQDNIAKRFPPTVYVNGSPRAHYIQLKAKPTSAPTGITV